MDLNLNSNDSLRHSIQGNWVDVPAISQNNSPLFTAVEEDNIKMLDKLLRQSEVNLNEKNCNGETALIMSIRMKRSLDFISKLIDSNCCLDATNAKGQTALYAAIINNANDIAHKLMEKGTDLDVQDEQNWTPLHYAVLGEKLECVNMLVSYGADVRPPGQVNQSPLILAYIAQNVDIIQTLLYHYHEFSTVNLKNAFFCLWNWYLPCDDYFLLIISIHNGFIEPFKLVWSRFDYEIVPLSRDNILLFTFINKSAFSAAEWFECLYLVLESPYANLERCHNFLIVALDFLNEKNWEHNRLPLINMCLSIGIEISLYEIYQIFRIAGFNEEVEALIYVGNYDLVKPVDENYATVYDIIGFQVDWSTQKIFDCLYDHALGTKNPDDIIPWFKYFSLSAYMKSTLKDPKIWFIKDKVNQINAHICHVQEFPSLVELSRNQVQKFIRQTHKITKPYQFFDAVKGLCLPKILQEVVLFQRPIYAYECK